MKLLFHIVGIVFMYLVPSYEELLVEVWFGVGQFIFRAEQPSVGGYIAGHISSAGCGP
jgi:hypothetical protein